MYELTDPFIDTLLAEGDSTHNVTIVMSREELEATLAVDAAIGAREKLVHERPTITMTAVKV